MILDNNPYPTPDPAQLDALVTRRNALETAPMFSIPLALILVDDFEKAGYVHNALALRRRVAYYESLLPTGPEAEPEDYTNK